MAIAFNILVNMFIGGGGEIALVASINWMFSTQLILLIFALAVTPIPLAVWIVELNTLNWLH